MAGISVIVCCYNSARRLPETLLQLSYQDLAASAPWEIILVDNASDDQTAEIAERIWRELASPVSLRVVHEPNPGLACARRKGIDSANYEIIVFVDDDNWLAPNYLAVAMEVMTAHPEIGALGGLIEARCEVPPPGWFEQMKGNYAIGEQAPKSGDISKEKGVIAGAGMVLRKSAYQELTRREFRFLLSGRAGGTLTSGEDVELCHAMILIGFRVWYEERLRLTHFIPASRLTAVYLEKLQAGNMRSGLIAIIYWLAIFKSDSSATWLYFLGLVKLLRWSAQSLYGLLFKGRDRLILKTNLTTFFFYLRSFPEFVHLYKKYSPDILALKQRNLSAPQSRTAGSSL